MTEPMRATVVPWPEEGLIARGELARHEDGTWYCRTPNGHFGNLAKHAVVEHEDGTLTVTPSIRVFVHGGRTLWHGTLERGVWTECAE